MENRKLVYLFGIVFSVMFAFLYFFLFDTLLAQENTNSATLYFNQVGLYKDEENSTKTIAKLKEQDIEAYAIKKEDMTAVVCGVSEQREETQKLQAALDTLGITYIEKQVTVEDPAILKEISNKEITKALEMMKY